MDDGREPLSFEGRWTRHTFCPPLFVPAATDPAPLLVGGLGPKMVALAVEAADGLLVHPFCTDASGAALLADVPDEPVAMMWIELLATFDVVLVTLALLTFEPLMTE